MRAGHALFNTHYGRGPQHVAAGAPALTASQLLFIVCRRSSFIRVHKSRGENSIDQQPVHEDEDESPHSKRALQIQQDHQSERQRAKRSLPAPLLSRATQTLSDLPYFEFFSISSHRKSRSLFINLFGQIPLLVRKETAN